MRLPRLVVLVFRAHCHRGRLRLLMIVHHFVGVRWEVMVVLIGAVFVLEILDLLFLFRRQS